jgi:hypothetical protein
MQNKDCILFKKIRNCINYLNLSNKIITKKNVMKSVFISFCILRLLIITDTTIDRNLGTDYEKWIFDKQ